jgi:O-antigen ligase
LIRPVGTTSEQALIALAAATLAGCAGAGAGIAPVATIAAVLGAVFIVLTMNSLLAGACVLAVLSFADAPTAGSFLTPAKVVGVLVAFSWLALVLTREGDQLYKRRRGVAIICVALTAWLALSLTWAEDSSTSAVALSRYIPNLLLIPIIYAAVVNGRAPGRRFEILLGALVLGAAIAAAIGVLTPPKTPLGGTELDTARTRGTFDDANEYAAAMLVGFALALGFAAGVRRSRRWRATLITIAVLCLLGLVLTLSRGGLVALVLTAIAFAVGGGEWRAKWIAGLSILLLLVVTYFAAVAPPEARQRVTRVNGGTGRTSLWTVGVRMFEARTKTGVGIGNFPVASIHYLLQPGAIQRDDLIISKPLVAHNTYLQFAAETGLPGVSLFLLLVASSLGATLRSARTFRGHERPELEVLARSLFAATIGYLAASLFISSNYSKLLWMLLALGFASWGAATQLDQNTRATT